MKEFKAEENMVRKSFAITFIVVDLLGSLLLILI